MIAKHQISHNVRNLLAYCLRVGKHQAQLEKTKPRILMANHCPQTKNLKALTAQIKGANDMRKTDRVHHLIFAHPKSDVKRVAEVGEAQLIQEALEGLLKKGVNLLDAPFVVIAHQDKDNHIDYHLIAAATDLNGKAIKDGYIGSRAMNITNQISKKYGLTLNNDKTQEKRKRRKEEPAKEVELEKKQLHIELADVEDIDIDLTNITQAEGKDITKDLRMPGEAIEERREEQQKQEKKIQDFNEQCDEFGLSQKERQSLWIGLDVSFERGRRYKGLVNDSDISLRGRDTGEKITLVAVIKGVVKSVREWATELLERIRLQKQEQDDKARKQSQEETQKRTRGRGFKR